MRSSNMKIVGMVSLMFQLGPVGFRQTGRSPTGHPVEVESSVERFEGRPGVGRRSFPATDQGGFDPAAGYRPPNPGEQVSHNLPPRLSRRASPPDPNRSGREGSLQRSDPV